MCIFCLCDLKISHQDYLILSVYFLYKSIRCKINNLQAARLLILQAEDY